jgi:hypothetical protein
MMTGAQIGSPLYSSCTIPVRFSFIVAVAVSEAALSSWKYDLSLAVNFDDLRAEMNANYG